MDNWEVLESAQYSSHRQEHMGQLLDHWRTLNTRLEADDSTSIAIAILVVGEDISNNLHLIAEKLHDLRFNS